MTSLAAIEKRLAAIAHRRCPAPASSRLEMIAQLGLQLDDWQRAVLESDAPQILLNASRQSGKSMTCALRGITEALLRPGSLILAVAPTERQSRLLFATMVDFYRRLGRPIVAETENRLSLELVNGSRLFALPGDPDTVRGFAGVDLLLLDEASRIPDPMIAATRPMLAVSGGRLIALTTPWGKRGWFWHSWSDGGDAWERYEIPASQCPRITPEFLTRERAALGDLWFRSEYLCEFTETVDAVFRTADIEAAFAAGVPPLFAPEETDHGPVALFA